MAEDLLIGGMGPCETAWEEFRAAVCDPAPHFEDDTDTRTMFLCGMLAAVELIEAGVSADQVCAEINKLVTT